MAISYPLNLPSNRQISAVRMTTTDIVGQSISPFTASQQIYKYSGQYWEADITLRPMTRDEAEYWISFLLKLNGAYGTFLLGDPNGAIPRGVATGTPLVRGGGQVGSELITDGWTANTTGILKAGDYIQVGSGSSSKLHKVLNDVNSDASGIAILDLYPAMRVIYADNAPITASNAKGVFRLSSNQTAWDIRESAIYGITFGAREAI